MFKNLKEQITTQVNKTSQIFHSTILSNDSENNRSRLDSDITQIDNYVSPVRQSFPPSDIESEYADGDENNHETVKMQKSLNTYKNKFRQLKEAYDEVEREKEHIKDVLQKQQDAFLKRQEQLREQITHQQQVNVKLKSTHQKEIKLRDQQIEELTKDREELQIQREKRVQLIQERDFLLQKLNEKQTVIKDPLMEVELQSAEQQIAELQRNLSTQNEQHSKSFDALKTEYENLTNELYQTKQAKDHIQSVFDQTDELLKAALTKLQHNSTQTPNEERISALKDEINRLQQLLDEQVNESSQQSSKDIEIETLKNEIIEKDRQIIERDEKIEEIQLALEQSKESNEKLRKALQKMKESIETNSTDKTSAEIRLQKLIEDYEQRLKKQEIEYDVKLKAMAKEMSTQIDEKEQNYKQQLHDFIENNQKIENELVNNSEQKLINAEQRALVAEEQMSRLDEQLKEKQLDHYRVVQDLQNQIRTLTKEKPSTTEHFSQTINEDSHLIELTEVDYLKEIFRGYMAGKDPITMVKVICAVLRCTDDETSSIIEQEKLRQSRWLNSSS